MTNRRQKKLSHYYDETVMEVKFKKICTKIRIARETKGLSQKDLAKKIGKTRNIIARIETEKNNITLKTLFDIIERGLNGKVEIIITINEKIIKT